MPRVPMPGGQSVNEAGLPGSRLSPEAPIAAFGGGQAAAAGAEQARGLAKDIISLASDERDAADAVVVQQADLETAKEKLRLLKDPKSGALNVRGQETLGLPDSVGNSFEKYAEGVRGRLTATQRSAYDKLLYGHRRDINDTLQTHIFGEMRKFDEATTAARLETAREEAALNFHDPARISAAIELQKTILRARADRDDLAGVSVPPEELDRQEKEAASKTHAAIITRMLTGGEDLTARRYYDDNKDGLTATDAQRVEAALRQGTILGESQRRAGAIMGAHPGDEKAAIEAARLVEDPEIQKATVDEVRTRFSEQRRIEKQNAEQAMQSAANIVEQTRDARSVPRPLWALLSPAERHALETRSRQLREGVEPVTDWPKYYDLKSRASSDVLRDSFLQENLLEQRPYLADSEFKELTSLQTSLRKGGEDAARKELDGYRTKAQIVNDGLNSIGIDPTPKPGTKASEEVAAFRNLVEEQAREIQRIQKREVTNKEVQEIVDRLVIKAATPGVRLQIPFTNATLPIPFTGSERRTFELLATKKSEVPRPEILKIETAMKRRGMTPTDEAVVDLYNRRIQQRISGAR